MKTQTKMVVASSHRYCLIVGIPRQRFEVDNENGEQGFLKALLLTIFSHLLFLSSRTSGRCLLFHRMASMTCGEAEYGSTYIRKERGDIVLVDVSVWTAFLAAIDLLHPSTKFNGSHRTRVSSIDTNFTGAGTRKMRPAIILERTDDASGPPAYLVALLTSMCGTPYDSLNTNAKDVLMPVVGRQRQELPKGLPTITTIPEWNKCYQYVVTAPVTTSNVWEWYPEIRVSEKNLAKLEEFGEQQVIDLAQKLKNQPGKGKWRWFKDIASTGVVSGMKF
jgi:hypothetical protein